MSWYDASLFLLVPNLCFCQVTYMSFVGDKLAKLGLSLDFSPVLANREGALLLKLNQALLVL